MISIVNDRYKYILFFSAKAGCTSIRKLYLAVHGEELSKSQQTELNEYHNVNALFAYDPERDYSDYYTVIITRNPYSRIVSAYLDQFVYTRQETARNMMANSSEPEPDNFLAFLESLKSIPDAQRDEHFQTQAFFAFKPMVVTKASPRYRWLKQKPPQAMGIKECADISTLNKTMQRVFKRVLRDDKAKLDHALKELKNLRKTNSSFYGETNFKDAAQLSNKELDELVFAPKPQDFFTSERVRNLVEEIYQADFDLFGYQRGAIPNKSTSSEIQALPYDFDWRMYLRLNPDLPLDHIYNERGVTRHYLEFGRFEEHPRAYKIVAPAGFEWQSYLSKNPDLVERGINDEMSAIEHYISYGVRQHRRF